MAGFGVFCLFFGLLGAMLLTVNDEKEEKV